MFCSYGFLMVFATHMVNNQLLEIVSGQHTCHVHPFRLQIVHLLAAHLKIVHPFHSSALGSDLLPAAVVTFV